MRGARHPLPTSLLQPAGSLQKPPALPEAEAICAQQRPRYSNLGRVQWQTSCWLTCQAAATVSRAGQSARSREVLSWPSLKLDPEKLWPRDPPAKSSLVLFPPNLTSNSTHKKKRVKGDPNSCFVMCQGEIASTLVGHGAVF